jgi:hypothetical protein
MADAAPPLVFIIQFHSTVSHHYHESAIVIIRDQSSPCSISHHCSSQHIYQHFHKSASSIINHPHHHWPSLQWAVWSH